MLTQFLLVGTNHAHQLVNNQHGKSKSFYRFLLNRCNESPVDLIAEEMSAEALIKYATTSISYLAANSIGIPHLLCDPNNAERTELNIPSEDELRAQLCLGNRRVGVVEKIDNAKKLYWPIREAEWLRRVEHQRCKLCLFILGSDHVLSFDSLIRKNGNLSRVLIEKWEH